MREDQWRFPGLSAACGILAVLWAPGTPAQGPIHVNPVLGNPSPSLAIPAKKASTPDPRAVEMRERFRQAVTKAHNPQAVSGNVAAASAPRPLPRQARSLDGLKQRLGADVEVHIRPGAGTPRQIKGTILQPAIYEAMAGGKPTGELTARVFLRQNRDLLRIQDPDRELRLDKNQAEPSGERHLRFTQRYKGIPVWPADLNVHLDAFGNVNLMDGAYVPTPNPKMVTTPTVQAAEAVATARSQFDGGKSAAITAQGLIFYAPGDRPTRLAWKVELSSPPRARWLVVVDAMNGRVLTAYNQIMEVNRAGSGIGPFGKRRELNVWEQGGQYFLVDTSKPMYDPSSNPPADVRGGITVMDLRNEKGNADATVYMIASDAADRGWLEDGVSVSFGLSKTYDYYREHHDRNSLDGNGGSMVGIVRTDVGGINAFWNGKAMIFGNTCKIAGAMDVIGHELTHGVTEKTANLVYQNQSGALNEAFSDIFGEAIEAYIDGKNDWLMAADLVFDGCMTEPMRNVKDPNAIDIVPGLPYPAKMSQFIRTDKDNGGVHLNSLIVTHAFYLLAEGLEGAIGMADAERIFYRALSLHLVRNSEFVDARLACIKAAEDIFGADSPQARKTTEAFDAVEVFGAEPTPDPPPGPAVAGDDATLFVYTSQGSYFLGRREPALGDDAAAGAALSAYSISPSRSAVSGDGTLAVFVDSVYDVCMIATNGSAQEQCIGEAGNVHSVAMSADGNRFAIVFRGADGVAENKISVFDLGTDAVDTYTLKSPAIDGLSDIEVLQADAMDFSLDGRTLVYDALNKFKLEGGGTVGGWSIYAIDLDSGDTLTIVPPVAGMDIGYPAMGSVNEQLMVFEAVDQWTSQSTTYVANLQTGDLGAVATALGVFSTPAFTGDDSAVVYSVADPFAFIGTSLYRQALGLDHISPSGSPELWMADRAFGVIYRRGAYTAPPRADLAATIEEQADPVAEGAQIQYRIRVSNRGPAPATAATLSITLVGPGRLSPRPAGCTEQEGGLRCDLGDMAAGSERLLLVGVTATGEGTLVHGAKVLSAVIDPRTEDNAAVAKTRVTAADGTPSARTPYQAEDAPLRGAAGGSRVALTTLNGEGHPLVLLDGDEHGTWDAHELPGDAASIQGGDLWFDPKDGTLNVAVPSASGLLLHTRDGEGYWRTRNLTEQVGSGAGAITNSLTHFITADGVSGYTVDEKDRNNIHIIGKNGDGDLVDYFQVQSDKGAVSWAYKNITRQDLIPGGQDIPDWVSNLVGYATPWNGWNIAGLNRRGEIIAVWTAPDRNGVWATTNLSTSYGTPPLDPSAGLTVYVNWGMNLAGVLPNGHLGITWWSRQYEDEQKAKGSDKLWAFSDITNQAGGPLLKPAAVAACTVRVSGRPDQESVHLAGLKQNGELVDYWWTPPAGALSGNWRADAIGGGNVPVRGLSASCGSDLRVSIAGIDGNGDILRYLWLPDRSWRFQNVTATVARP